MGMCIEIECEECGNSFDEYVDIDEECDHRNSELYQAMEYDLSNAEADLRDIRLSRICGEVGYPDPADVLEDLLKNIRIIMRTS